MKNTFFVPDTNFKAPLSRSLAKEYNALIKIILSAPNHSRAIQDIISYQIGWGTLLLSWYQAGIQHKTIQMPGAGFSTWDYTGLAEHFYRKYAAPLDIQLTQFHKLVTQIIDMTEKEHVQGNLNKIGVWDWCTLKSGKKWPLQKWIQVNTVAPYKRARTHIKKSLN